MSARELLEELRAAGITVAVRGNKLLVRPADRLTDWHRDALRAAKPEVLTLLATSGDAETFGAPAAPFVAEHLIGSGEAAVLAQDLIRAIAAQARRCTWPRCCIGGPGPGEVDRV